LLRRENIALFDKAAWPLSLYAGVSTKEIFNIVARMSGFPDSRRRAMYGRRHSSML
jgi:hypothetical protein